MCSPCKTRLRIDITVRVVVMRHIYRQPFSEVALILCIECHPVILRMSHDENALSSLCEDDEHPNLVRLSKYLKSCVG